MWRKYNRPLVPWFRMLAQRASRSRRRREIAFSISEECNPFLRTKSSTLLLYIGNICDLIRSSCCRCHWRDPPALEWGTRTVIGRLEFRYPFHCRQPRLEIKTSFYTKLPLNFLSHYNKNWSLTYALHTHILVARFYFSHLVRRRSLWLQWISRFVAVPAVRRSHSPCCCWYKSPGGWARSDCS